MNNLRLKLWNYKEKRFENNFELHFENGDIVNVLIHDKNYIYSERLENNKDKTEYKLLLCSNYQDKNKKNVYEGDITRDIRNNEIFIIKYIDMEFYCFNIDDNDDYGLAVLDNVIIIGNIYENPELIKIK